MKDANRKAMFAHMRKPRDLITKRTSCYGCGKEGHMSYDRDKQKWARAYHCKKCGSGSFQYYNY